MHSSRTYRKNSRDGINSPDTTPKFPRAVAASAPVNQNLVMIGMESYQSFLENSFQDNMVNKEE